MFKSLLKKCSEGITLTRVEAKAIMDEMMLGNVDGAQVASLLSMMRVRGETVEEMVGFALSMKEHAVSVDHDEKKLLDTCGTGGDDLGTFNVSTTTAILVSACGVKVAKHGNRAVSSKSGSADVLEKLQISVQSSPTEALAALQTKGLCFLFAPLYHQSMKHVADVRRQLGFKTVFNLLGPLVNPAKANRQVIGVFDPIYAKKMAETLRELGTERALFVTGGDGLDECSISTYTDVCELVKNEIIEYRLTPEEVGLNRGLLRNIQVTSVEESAKLIENIFRGKANKTAENIVIFNSGAALYVADEVETISEGVIKARQILSSGKGLEQLRFLQTTKEELQC
ncbi:anthranilate phosphoribosyltransferase [Anaerobacillus isosaccharinicus]|uniref:Anthranilate phosphoribosyltransferase n=1 Tax=Anaerobacillus isosaccharinicus TaxID=1532552 RepID=A0A1S2KXE8_9BACI|nr:anthranilate phosphoribosyltransferase [Anaerobacillus isosaccharinicus]MBA5585862.1 anthranilate phosphoribosyltransferase [Anaerobacillus isosaccharinicus]QOY35845.1 anthranilate phosphoribosyltransferase [Anaerobacillus isosaccharinicus]